MKQTSYTEIEHAERTDIGRIALIGETTLAIEDTVETCLRTARDCGMGTLDGEHLRPVTMRDIETGNGIEAVEITA